MIYLDSAAVIKLAHAEPETPALRGRLDERAETGWISSVLTEIKSFWALGSYALDAIHLGAALRSRSEVASFVTYDGLVLDAARAAGLPVDSPA